MDLMGMDGWVMQSGQATTTMWGHVWPHVVQVTCEYAVVGELWFDEQGGVNKLQYTIRCTQVDHNQGSVLLHNVHAANACYVACHVASVTTSMYHIEH